MSSTARFERERLRRFLDCWEPLFEVVPQARADAVKAMGEAMEQELHARIQAADLEADAKGTVISWQELRLGSGGGYAAVSPIKGKTVQSRVRTKNSVKMCQHTYKGMPVTSKQISGWLEKGHGVRKADTTKDYAWRRWGSRKTYVAGRQFYSFARLKSRDLAYKAADRVLSQIADEVDY